MKILLVNMARMGDLVQTTPTALALKKELDAEITLLVTGNLEKFGRRLDGIDHVISFDEINLVPHLRKGGSLAEGFYAWRHFINKLKMIGFDRVINLTHDAFSTRLVSAFETENITGRFQEKEGAIQIKGRWLRYFFAVVNHRNLNGINLVDIYRKGCGAGFYRQPVSMKVTLDDSILLNNYIDTFSENLVAIHPGANNEKRRYPIELYCKLADKLVADGYDLVVLGSDKEISLGEKIVNASWGMAENLAGKVPLELLPALMKKVRLLVTNDTGPLHVAAAVGIPTVSIYLAMARPEDTAPYGEGHFIFETMYHTHPCPESEACPNPVCGQTIPVESIRYVVNHILDEKVLDVRELENYAGNYRLLKTRFSDDESLQVLDEVLNLSDRKDLNISISMRKVMLACYDEYSCDEKYYQEVLEYLDYKDLEILSKSVDLAYSILQKIEGMEIQDTSGQPVSLMQLENTWYELEQKAKYSSFFMLPFRLERERLYANGLEYTRNEAPERFKKWIKTITKLSGIREKVEVAI